MVFFGWFAEMSGELKAVSIDVRRPTKDNRGAQ
jgi:hypothetical protein